MHLQVPLAHTAVSSRPLLRPSCTFAELIGEADRFWWSPDRNEDYAAVPRGAIVAPRALACDVSSTRGRYRMRYVHCRLRCTTIRSTNRSKHKLYFVLGPLVAYSELFQFCETGRTAKSA